MIEKQLQHATIEMINWLSHPQELGKAPAKIELGGEFDRNGLHYYIFKYKKSALGKWLLGICGGYEGDALQHCGHVFSEMQEYKEKTAEQDAIALIEYVESYWKEQAEEQEKKKESAGVFVNFVLLEENAFDKAALLRELKEEWQIEDEDNDKDKEKEDGTIAVLSYQGALAAISLMPAAIPEEEIVYHAESNFRWPNAVEVSKRHKAHLIVSVMGKEMPVKKAAELLVKVVAAACKQKGVLGIYANGTVYEPEFYLHFTEMLKENMFPLFNLVWFGLYKGKTGICGYTEGLRSLGFDEIEVIDSTHSPKEVGDFITDVAAYVTDEEVVLRDGETIGFTAEQKLPITKSRGVAVEGDSLKIGF